MQSEFLEIGQIVNTHGIRGEVKLVPWADSRSSSASSTPCTPTALR